MWPSDEVALSVSLCVCHTSEPCKIGWTDRDAVWVEDSGGPKELRDASPHHPVGRCNYEEGEGIATLCHELYKNNRLDWAAVWDVNTDVNTGGPKEAQGIQTPMQRDTFAGKDMPILS